MQPALPASAFTLQVVAIGQRMNRLLVGSQYCVPSGEQLGAEQLTPQVDAPGVQPLAQVEVPST